MAWFRRLLAKREPSALAAVTALLDAPPSPRLAGAIEQVAEKLTEERLGKGLTRLRPQLIMIFARQSEDAARRLYDSYWTSDRGHNVGKDVYEAYNAAFGAFLIVLDRRPRSKTPLLHAIAAIEALKPPLRIEPADPAGYGLATLGEIQRDLSGLL